MKFLCLAYGDEAGWNALSQDEQRDALAHDAVIRNRGNLMSALEPMATAVRNWNGNLEVSEGPGAHQGLLLAGFSVIEAGTLEEVIALVSNTPCARARGFIEIRPFRDPGEE
ncbi:MAG TPA: YciI family protein [Gemmatimonadaceae bacterium]|jgi:hypothetical protein|nr:YciI family protein [Gemmatimonadaceae bacterium]